MKRITSRCYGVQEKKCLSLVKHSEYHMKEIFLKKGIVLMLGSLHHYSEYCYHLECLLGWRKSRDTRNTFAGNNTWNSVYALQVNVFLCGNMLLANGTNMHIGTTMN